MLPNDDQQTRRTVDPSSTPQGDNLPPKQPDDVISQSGGSFQKEKELIKQQDERYIEEIGKELELEKEVEKAGVEKIGEEITLPEPVKQQGVKVSGENVPVISRAQTNIPLNQVQIKKALHKKITDSILWLAIWCLRQLKIQKSKNNEKE